MSLTLLYIGFALSHASLALTGDGPHRETLVKTTCLKESSDVERVARSHLLTERDWRMLRRIAAFRSEKGLEVLPDMLGCPSLTKAAYELVKDKTTAGMLKERGYSSRDYIEIAWAVLIANDPEGFGVKPNRTVAANMRFLAHRPREVRALLDWK